MGADDLLITDQPDERLDRQVRDGLIAFNEPFLGRSDHRPLRVFVPDGEGGLRGGLIAETGRGFLEIRLFWVAEVARRQGLGSRLLAAAEAEAMARGCHAAWVGTYDFQARPFYERHGYRVFGRLAGFPNGHESFFLVKRLAKRG